MSEFEKYIEAKYPNRSPKILFQKFKDIDGTLFYGIKEVEDQAEAWNHQQAIIDDLIYKAKLRESDHQALLVKYQATKKCWEDMGKECESLKAQLNNMEACYIEKKKEVEGLHKRVDVALFEMQQLSLMLSKDIDGYEDPAQICQSEGVDMGVRILEKALRGEHESN